MDITELVIAKKQLREQEGKAIYAAKLASLGEMAAGIAHEINNPLTIILGSATIIEKLIEDKTLDKIAIKQLTKKLIVTSERISKTIASLKSLSRSGENDSFEEIEFSMMLEQCLDICRQRCDLHGIKLILPAFDGLVLFKGREGQLSQVVLNLLSNAIDAVKNCNECWIEVSYQQNPDSFDIFISDSGTGLGLSISKTIMNAHKGELNLVPGSPTTFIMHLPILT